MTGPAGAVTFVVRSGNTYLQHSSGKLIIPGRVQPRIIRIQTETTARICERNSGPKTGSYFLAYNEGVITGDSLYLDKPLSPSKL